MDLRDWMIDRNLPITLDIRSELVSVRHHVLFLIDNLELKSMQLIDIVVSEEPIEVAHSFTKISLSDRGHIGLSQLMLRHLRSVLDIFEHD